MKLFKSLLLASATGLVAVSGASAADLGAKKPSPVEYVKACYNPLWGTSGGFVIPGGNTCLRVGGQARFDIGYGQPYLRNNSTWGYRGGGSIFLDAITPSEYGNVRAYVNMTMLYRTGGQRTGTGARWGQTIDGSIGTNLGAPAGTDFSGSSGFIQFAGFTFGRTASFYNTVGIAPSILGTSVNAGPGNVNQVAYTANLGNGFLATIALEDPTTRRQGIGTINSAGFTPATFNPALVGMSVPGVAVNVSNNSMPNLVAALRIDQAWGSAEISGIATQIRSGNLTTPVTPGASLFGNAGYTAVGYASTKYGFSVTGGLKINLPMLAAGDALYLNGTYADGMVSSILGNYFFGALPGGANLGGVNVTAYDAMIDPLNGSLKTTKGWGVNAGFQHFWTPTVATSLSGAYGAVNHSVINNGIGDYKIWMVGLLNTWTPVRGLTFGLDLGYVAVDPKGRVVDVQKNAAPGGAALNGLSLPTAAQITKSRDGQFVGRFRVVRDF